MTTTLKLDWDDNTISAVRVALLAVAEVYESMGTLPGYWNLNDAVRLRGAADDMRQYTVSREDVKRSEIVRLLTSGITIHHESGEGAP